MSASPVAIITGAGSGIGRATAIELAAAGWRCALVGRRRDRLAQTAAMMANSDSIIVEADIADVAASQRIVDETIAKRGAGDGRIDALINNAATLITGPIDKASDDDLRRSFDTNVIAAARLVRSVWPTMVKAGAGRIINVSSMSSIDPFPGLGVYGMSKAALEGLTRSINVEGKREGLIAFSIILGAVETEMLRSFVSEKMLPRNKVKDPAEIARVIAACAKGERDGEARTPIIMK